MSPPRKLLFCALPLCVALGGVMPAQAAAPDLLLSTPATPDAVEKGMHADGYSLAISAYNWGYPLVRMERVAREYTRVPSPKPATSYRAGLNQIGWATALASPSAKDMPTANNDTYYMSAVLDLTEPYVLSVPDTQDRYYVVDVFNMWQELEHYVGRRTTGTQAGKFVLVPPGWTGELPKDAKRLDVSTGKIWLWGRMQVKQGEDVAPILALQKQFSVAPLSGKAPAAETLPALPQTDDSLGFFTELAAALKDNPVKPADAALFAQFARIGLTDKGFSPEKLDPATRKGLEEGLKVAPYVAIASLASTSSIRNGWNWVTGLDSFGYNYPLRAMVAGPYLGGQGEREAMYPIRFTDSKNQPLTGAHRYEIKLASAPPVDAFWSLTMYDANDKMLVDNPINRYKVGTDTQGLKVAADGSITIPISHDKPTGEHAANWLPAPKGGFYVLLRLYQPKEDVLSDKWKLPQLNRVD
ncbi:DUF1214 domain-containing protein [Pseudomonas sp. RG1]|uniref:DUF1254 domain-containing protein n=1 Tax=Pseudomonas sp. RG1 TaxID=2981602 RepID=UPI00221FF9E9|nr:DUF1254 domain-containing protein [Pseudomonas sp. RG1]MCW0921141.1 DUF1214 domain-containing protein [Pseudomonas sp. RG1]